MSTPTVIEVTPSSEPVAHDTFIDDLTRRPATRPVDPRRRAQPGYRCV